MVNQGTILGRVGKIDTKTTSSGVKITNCSMVTSKKFVKNGEKTEKVTWHNVTLFNKLAEIAEKYVSVGDLLYVQGEMDNQKYTTQDGQERTKFFVIAHDLKLMPKSKEHAAAPKDKPYDAGIEDDEIPW